MTLDHKRDQDFVRCYDEESAQRMLRFADKRLACRLCDKPSVYFIAAPNKYGFNVYPGYCEQHGEVFTERRTTPVAGFPDRCARCGCFAFDHSGPIGSDAARECPCEECECTNFEPPRTMMASPGKERGE